jgi:hypothetical protein
MIEKTAPDTLDNDLSRSSPPADRPYYPPRQRKIHDSDVTFEEYHFYAQRTREEQRLQESPQLQWRTVFSSRKKTADAGEEKNTGTSDGQAVTDEEWSNASRAFRTAGWGAVFYLVGKLLEAKGMIKG